MFCLRLNRHVMIICHHSLPENRLLKMLVVDQEAKLHIEGLGKEEEGLGKMLQL